MGYAQPGAFTYGLGEIMRRLGQDRHNDRARSEAWQMAYVAKLQAEAHFPAPIPLLIGDALVTAIKPKSRWPQAAVDRWFDDRTPSGPTAADRAAQRAGEAEMDARAEAIGARMAERGLQVVDGGRA